MSRDLDTRGRQAAASLRAAIEEARLEVRPPVNASGRKRVVAVLRPALIGALLLIGSAVGVALVIDSEPPTTTLPPVSTTIVVTTVATVPEPEATPTTVYTPPVVAPPTTTPADEQPPHLEITFPAEGAHVESKSVTFRGVTEPGAQVFAGKYEADVDASGNWQILLIVSEGANIARFTARDSAGNEAQAAVTVYYEAPRETTTTTIEKELAEFSASASFGFCSATPPYDVYYGTGQPGSVVNITSEYGSAVVEVNGEGHWEKQVFFEAAPPGVPFMVTVKDEFGRSKKFEFVYTPE